MSAPQIFQVEDVAARKRDGMSQDTPIRLAEAAGKRGLTVSSLRTEARRGRLTVWRVAGKDWTSLAEIDRMFEKCRVPPKEPIYGLGQLAAMDSAGSSETPAGLSKTEDARLARLGAGDRMEAEKRLAADIAEKYQPGRRERPLSEIKIADVIRIYLDDVVPGQARPGKAAVRAERLLQFFGLMTLEQITGTGLCRVAARAGKVE
jgi:hypothetical protein